MSGDGHVDTALTAPWPFYDEDERAAAAAVLASGRVNYWTGGEARAFEQEFAARVGVRRAIALANGSVALELPLRMWGVGPGDEVIVTPRSFIASASCVSLVGAQPVFADVDPDSGNLTAETIARALTPRTRAVIVVHLAGWPCEMDPIMALADSAGIKVLEDCAQSHGARYRGRVVGSIGHAAAFSFCQDKIISTGGEGGMLVTDDEELWERAWSFKDHGKTWEAVYERRHGPGYRWVHERLGTNWRMTEFQAAIGRVQLRKLEDWVARRRELAAIFARLDGPVLRMPAPPPHMEHACYRWYGYVRAEALKPGWDRDRLAGAIAARGVPCFVGACPELYREGAFAGTPGMPRERLPVAVRLGQESLCFLVHPTLTARQVETAVAVIGEVLAEAAR